MPYTYVLAGALGDYSTAFARYEQTMRGYVVANQKLAGSVKDFVPQTWTQIWLRTQALRVLSYLPWKGLVVGKMMRDIQQAATLSRSQRIIWHFCTLHALISSLLRC